MRVLRKTLLFLVLCNTTLQAQEAVSRVQNPDHLEVTKERFATVEVVT